ETGRRAVLHAADLGLPPGDLAFRPHRAGRNVMQSADNALDTRLPHVVDRGQVVRAKPTPSLSHLRISLPATVALKTPATHASCPYQEPIHTQVLTSMEVWWIILTKGGASRHGHGSHCESHRLFGSNRAADL